MNKDYFSHCVKVQKYIRAQYVSNFFTCGANNVVEYYGKRIKILNGCPYEGQYWQSMAIQALSAKKVGMALPCYFSPQKDTL